MGKQQASLIFLHLLEHSLEDVQQRGKFLPREQTVFVSVHFGMQPIVNSRLLPNNGNQIISMQKCAVGRKAAAAMWGR